MSPSPLADLTAQKSELLATIASLATLDELLAAEPRITGKRSFLSTLQKSLGSLEPDARKDAGALLQAARRDVESALEARRSTLAAAARAQVLEADRLDPVSYTHLRAHETVLDL